MALVLKALEGGCGRWSVATFNEQPASTHYHHMLAGISECHAKELAKRINALLEMTEEQLCPPSCCRCGAMGTDKFALVRRTFDHPETKDAVIRRLCLDCKAFIDGELRRFQ